MLFKIRFYITSLILISLIFSCTALGQVGFPPTNTIYTVEDGREFVEFWRGEGGSNWSSVGDISRIFIQNNLNITVMADKLETFSQKGNLVSSYPPPSYGKYCFDNKGNLVIYNDYDRNPDVAYSLSVFSPQGKFIRRIPLPLELHNYESRYFDFESKPDGGFCIWGKGNMNYHYNDDDDNDIMEIYSLDSDGQIVSFIDLRNYFQPRDEEVQQLVPGKNNCIYLFGWGDIGYKLSQDGRILKRFSAKSIKLHYFNKTLSLNHQGNIAAIGKSTQELVIFDLDGKKIENINISFNTEEEHEIANFAFDKQGNIYIYDNQNISKHDKNGVFIKHLFSITDSVFPYHYPFNGVEYYQGRAITKGLNGEIITSSYMPGLLYRFSQDGSLLSSLELENKSDKQHRDQDINQIEFASSGNIYTARGKTIRVYNPEGKMLRGRSRPEISGKINFTLDHKDNVFIAGKRKIEKWSCQLKMIEIFFLRENSAKGKTFIQDIVFGPDNLVNILDSASNIKKFSMDGELRKSLRLPSKASKLQFDDSGNYVGSGSYYTPRGRLLAQPISNNYSDYLQIKNRLFAITSFEYYFGAGDRGILSISTMRVNAGSQKTGQISGSIKMSQKTSIIVFLSGKTPDGRNIYSIAQTSNNKSKSFSFVNIPIGSTYKIWTDHPSPDSLKFERPVYKGVLKDGTARLEIKEQAIPPTFVKIKGQVVNKFGHPIPGVRISFGDQYVLTNLYGHYTLPVKEHSLNSLKATKNSYTFLRATRPLKISNTDKLFYNFREK